MSYLPYEATLARNAEIHREAESTRRVALARHRGRRSAQRRRWLRPSLGLLVGKRRGDERITRPASSTP
jgi:hypothetical protein